MSPRRCSTPASDVVQDALRRLTRVAWYGTLYVEVCQKCVAVCECALARPQATAVRRTVMHHSQSHSHGLRALVNVEKGKFCGLGAACGRLSCIGGVSRVTLMSRACLQELRTPATDRVPRGCHHSHSAASSTRWTKEKPSSASGACVASSSSRRIQSSM